MATGLAIPPRANKLGGVALSSGEDQDKAIIGLALASNENENYFLEDSGIGDDMIFDISDPLAQADILGRLRKVFNTFTRLKRFKLLEDTIAWTRKDGDMILSFKYLTMETDSEPRVFSQPLANGGGQAALNPSNNAT